TDERRGRAPACGPLGGSSFHRRTHPMSRFLRRLPTLRAGFALGLLALATAPGFAQEDKVVATVNGKPVTEADIALAVSDLDEQFSRLPEEQRRAAALSAIIEINLMAGEAASKGIDKDAAFQRRLDFLTKRALHAALID